MSTTAEVSIACPSWCQGKASEHRFEADHGFPIAHFAHVRRAQPALPVQLTLAVDPTNGARSLRIGVADDPEYDDIDLAEQTALAMLEAVRIARSMEDPR